MGKGIRILTLRSLAGGMGAGLAVVITAVVLAIISAIQGLGLFSLVQSLGFGSVGTIVWNGSDWAAALILAAIAGFTWGVGVRRERPGFGRGVLAWVYGFAMIAIPLMFVRWLLGLQPWSSGSVLFIAGFLSAFVALWGMGGFSPGYNIVETAGQAAERDVLDPVEIHGAFDPIQFGRHSMAFSRARILPIVRPLLGPMAIALGVVMLVIVAVMAIGSLFPGRIQTDQLSAAATTPVGYVAGLLILGQPVSKLAFFILIAVLIIAGIATIALGIALLINALTTQIVEAKAEPPHPLDYSDEKKVTGPFGHAMNFFIRLGHFLIDWVNDIRHGAARAVNRS